MKPATEPEPGWREKHAARMAEIARLEREELPKLAALAAQVAAEYEEQQQAFAEQQRLEERALDLGVPFPDEEGALRRLEKRMRREGGFP